MSKDIDNMKKQLLDGQLTLKQRRKLRNTLQGKWKKVEMTGQSRDRMPMQYTDSDWIADEGV